MKRSVTKIVPVPPSNGLGRTTASGLVSKIEAVGLLILLLAGNFGCAYFNTYYNAQKLYKTASKKHRQFPDTLSATAPEKENLQKAIDKYAAIVLKYPDSRWALPSLYNMGNSYYLRGEYDKASRKYQEIWQYYSDGRYSALSRLNEAVISYKMHQWDKALWEISQIKSDDKDIAQKAAYLEALVFQEIPDLPRAVTSWERFLFKHYKSGLALNARYNYALCLFELNEFTNSTRELENILDSRINYDLRHNVTMLLGQAYQRNARYSDALSLYRKLLRRELDKTRIARIELEIDNCLAQSGPAEPALANYQELTRKYPKTEVSSSAFFKIGQIYENRQELDSALAYYNKARNENPSPTVREAALKKSVNISLLLSYRQQSDQKAADQSAKLQFLMAEHYLFGMQLPDSAYATYTRVATSFADMPLAPKALYAAAWTAREYLREPARSDSLLGALIEKYPRSRYANGARQILNLPLDTLVTDSEPEIEMNVKPLEATSAIRTNALADTLSRQARPDSAQSDQLPENQQIPIPDQFKDRSRQ